MTPKNQMSNYKLQNVLEVLSTGTPSCLLPLWTRILGYSVIEPHLRCILDIGMIWGVFHKVTADLSNDMARNVTFSIRWFFYPLVVLSVEYAPEQPGCLQGQDWSHVQNCKPQINSSSIIQPFNCQLTKQLYIPASQPRQTLVRETMVYISHGSTI